MPQLPCPHSALDALLAYEAHVQSTLPPKQANAIMAQVRTALWRYTLPGWGLPHPQGQRLAAEEYERGLQLLKQLPFERLHEAPAVQEQLFEQLGVAKNSQRNYRWALKRWLAWCQQQAGLESERMVQGRRPNSRERQYKRSAHAVRLTTRRARQSYHLGEAQQPAALQQELALFFQFLTGAAPDEQNPTRLSAATAKQYLAQVERVLGWLHFEQRVPLQALSLRQLVVSAGAVGREPLVLPSPVAAESVVALVQAYLEWLTVPKADPLDGRSEATQSPYTALRVINTWLAVVRFVYRQASAKGKEAEQAQMTLAALRALRKTVTVQLKSHQPVSDESQKQLEWQEFLGLVETLRGECIPRLQQSTHSKQGGSTLAPLRSLTAIGQSYQRFLLVAFLAYIPPQRSQVLRTLAVAGLPLPESALKTEVMEAESVLYPDSEGWWLKLVPPKPKGQHSPCLIQVPNLSYSDGRCFYQYLEEWLLHYVYEDVHGTTVTVPGLRSCFNPYHRQLFTQKKGAPYAEAAPFSKLLRYPAYRLTGKALDFHTVRRMYAAFLQHKEKPLQDSEVNVLHSAFAARNTDEADQYNPADWSRAAAIAQAFLKQPA
jgi:hypothetical protein